MKRVVVIGAGPAGIAAALEAARGGCQVILLDKNSITGRKLRITGGGRGNLTNLNVSTQKYFSHQENGFIQSVIHSIGPGNMIAWFRELGIFTWHTDDGWVYPASNSAINVTSLLTARLIEAGVQLEMETSVKDIHWSTDDIEVITDKGEYRCSKVIIACGGKAYPDLGSTGELFAVMRKLGHQVWPNKPALAPVATDMKAIHKLQGVRLDANVSLWKKDDLIAETTGNIIFTNWGINGPGVMDISHWVNEYPQESLFLQMNFLGRYSDEFLSYIQTQRDIKMAIGALLGSVMPEKLVNMMLDRSGIAINAPISKISPDKLDQLLSFCQCFRIGVKELKGFDQCQVSSGGISLAEVDSVTMQSKLFPGLFFAGEMLDVIGSCGGYNLHWAFATGILAGKGVVI